MDLNTILNPLSEMAYPAEFSMDKLKSFNSYAKRIAYVESLLTRIASGSSRSVYKVDDEKVLKVAKNKKGLDQNLAESDWGAQQYSVIAKVFDTDDDGIFLEMELARKVTPVIFRKTTGITLEGIYNFLGWYGDKVMGSGKNFYFNYCDKDVKQLMETTDWGQSLLSFVGDYQYPLPGDFGRPSTYGLVERDGQPWIVVIDFGFTQSVLDTHYSKKGFSNGYL